MARGTDLPDALRQSERNDFIMQLGPQLATWARFPVKIGLKGRWSMTSKANDRPKMALHPPLLDEK